MLFGYHQKNLWSTWYGPGGATDMSAGQICGLHLCVHALTRSPVLNFKYRALRNIIQITQILDVDPLMSYKRAYTANGGQIICVLLPPSLISHLPTAIPALRRPRSS